jgi:hypothetical protein
MSTEELSVRDKRVYELAASIASLLREHPERGEAIDAHDMARVMFRSKTTSRPFQVPSEYLQERV